MGYTPARCKVGGSAPPQSSLESIGARSSMVSLRSPPVVDAMPTQVWVPMMCILGWQVSVVWTRGKAAGQGFVRGELGFAWVLLRR